jgi:hypothetical protein
MYDVKEVREKKRHKRSLASAGFGGASYHSAVSTNGAPSTQGGRSVFCCSFHMVIHFFAPNRKMPRQRELTGHEVIQQQGHTAIMRRNCKGYAAIFSGN